MEEVLQEALAMITGDGAEKKKAEHDLAQLVAQSPRCYGVSRRNRWWAIVLENLGSQEVVTFYLCRFPDQLTDRQWRQVEMYLVDKRKFDETAVKKAMVARFTRRRRISRRRECLSLVPYVQ